MDNKEKLSEIKLLCEAILNESPPDPISDDLGDVRVHDARTKLAYKILNIADGWPY